MPTHYVLVGFVVRLFSYGHMDLDIQDFPQIVRHLKRRCLSHLPNSRLADADSRRVKHRSNYSIAPFVLNLCRVEQGIGAVQHFAGRRTSIEGHNKNGRVPSTHLEMHPIRRILPMQIRNSRWLPLAILTLLTSYAAQSWALGLGEIEVDSSLNERFDGSIELLDARGLQPTEVIVTMASREDFERVGVERFFYLTDLKFEVNLNAASGAEVKVSSSKAVSEPYLNFIVEVLWPNGRLLKEYTVLLDPPTFSQAQAPAVRAPIQVTESTPEPRQSESSTNSPSAASGRVALAPRTAPAERPSPDRFTRQQQPAGGRVMTTRDDTLWTLASRTLPSQDVTVNQQMLAIQRLNRKAFIRDNINLMKAGYNLELPDANEALSMTADDADYNVANQTNAWKSNSPTQVADARSLEDPADTQLRSQVDATDAPTGRTAAQGSGDGQVRIVASDGNTATGTTAEAAEPKVNQLIEETETLNRQVDELSYQLDRERDIASNQVEVKDRQLEVKSQEIAELQQQLSQMREQLADRANQNQSAEVEPVETVWWQTPIVLMGVIGFLILLLVGLLIAMRRSRNADDEHIYGDDDHDEFVDDYDDEQAEASIETQVDDEEDYVHTAVEPVVGAITDDGQDEVLSLDEDYESDGSSVVLGADDLADDENPETQTSDVIGEAEIYIAYGRFGQAANLLLGVLNKNPEMYDVRLKLLEVFVESGDDGDFAEHAQFILDNCDDEEVLLACRDLEGQLEDGQMQDGDLIEDIGDEAADASLDTDQAKIATALDGDHELLEGLDELDDTFEGDDATATLAAGTIAAEAIDGVDSDEFELEFDVDDLEEDSPDDESSEGASDQMGGDLGIGFDADRDVEDLGAFESNEEADSDPDSGAEKSNAELDDLLAGLDDGEDSAAELGTLNDLEDFPETSESDEEFEFDAAADADINATKIDLAEAYIDMGDVDGARDILLEVLDEGLPEQKNQGSAVVGWHGQLT